MLTLGFDTSNYTTSVAAFDGVGGKNCFTSKRREQFLPPTPSKAATEVV